MAPDPKTFLAEVEARAQIRPDWFQKRHSSGSPGTSYRWTVLSRRKHWRRVLDRHVDGEPSILDFGCGDGTNLELLAGRKGAKVFGVDYNLDRLCYASQHAPASVVLIAADILAGAIRPASMDVVFCNHVLEHIERDRHALERVREILKPEGILLLGVPNDGCLLAKLRDFVLQPYIRFVTDHVHFYSKQSLQRLLEAVGFEILDFAPLGMSFPVTFVDRFLRRFRRIDSLGFALGRLVPSQCDMLAFTCKRH